MPFSVLPCGCGSPQNHPECPIDTDAACAVPAVASSEIAATAAMTAIRDLITKAPLPDTPLSTPLFARGPLHLISTRRVRRGCGRPEINSTDAQHAVAELGDRHRAEVAIGVRAHRHGLGRLL